MLENQKHPLKASRRHREAEYNLPGSEKPLPYTRHNQKGSG